MSKSVVIRGKQKGMVALFMAITIQIILTFSFLEFTDNNMRYISTVRNYEDKVKSKYLAKSSVNFSILLLVIQSKMINPMNQRFKLNFQIWQQLPISSELLSMIFDGDSDFFKSMIGMDDDENTNEIETEKEVYERKANAKDELSKKAKVIDGKIEQEDGKMTFENKFKFDGDFFAEITDENKKYSVNYFSNCDSTAGTVRGKCNHIKYNLEALFNQPEYKLFFESERENETVISGTEVVSSIRDWIDKNDERDGLNGGAEDDRYTYLKRKYRTKNAKLISFEELYMIYGIDDDFMESFGESLTVYTDNKININTCSETIIRSIICGVMQEQPQQCIDPHSEEMAVLVSEVLELRTIAPFSKAEEFFSMISRPEWVTPTTKLKNQFELITSSTVFKITGYGTLNEAVSKITVIIDMANFINPLKEKQYRYYREE